MAKRTSPFNPQPEEGPRQPADGTIPLDRALDELHRAHPDFFAPAPDAPRSPRRRHHCYPAFPGWRRWLADHRADWATMPPAGKRRLRRVWKGLRLRHARLPLASFEALIRRVEIRVD